MVPNPRTRGGGGPVVNLRLAQGAFVTAAGSLAGAIGALPLEVAAGVGLGTPAAVLGLAQPLIALALLLFSIPFSTLAKVTIGQFTVTSTDVLVALLLAGWLGPALVARNLALRAGPIMTLASLFLASAVLSTTTATDLPGAVKELIKFCEMIGVALFAASRLNNPGSVHAVFWLVTAAASAEALVGLAQFVTGTGPEAFQIGPFIRAYGTFEQPNALAGYLAVSLPFAVVVALRRSRGQPLGMAGALVIAAGIAVSLSRGAWVGVVLGLAAMALAASRKARLWVGAAAGVILVVLILARAGLTPETVTSRLAVFFENFWIFDARTVDATPANWSLVERMAHWQAGWAIAIDHPIIGIGPGNWDKVYDDYYLPGWREGLGHAHNYYINTVAELGLVGLVTFLALLTAVFIQLRRGLRASVQIRDPDEKRRMARLMLIASLGATIAFCMHNIFDNMFIHGISVQLGLIFGLIESQTMLLVRAQGSQEHSSPMV